MNQTIATKESFVELAKEMKRDYTSSPRKYGGCSSFKRMQTIMETMTIENFVLPAFPTRVAEAQLHVEENLRISLFFIPKGTEMPLHDHPGMFVLCKILKGKLIRDNYRLDSNYWQFNFPQEYLKVPPIFKSRENSPPNNCQQSPLLKRQVSCRKMTWT